MARSTAFFTLLLTVLLAGPVRGQNTRAPLVLSVPPDARSAALGGAFVTVSGDATGFFYNPALAARTSGFTLSRAWYGAEGAFTQLSGGASGGGRGLAVGVRALGYAVALQPPPASPRLATSEAELFRPGYAAQELATTAAVATRLFGVQVGVAANFTQVRTGTLRGSAATFDVGVVQSVGPAALGLAVQGIGRGITLGSGASAQAYDAPRRATFNVATERAPVGPLDIGGAAVVSAWDGYFAAGGGLEIAYWPVVGRTFIARLGVLHDDDGTRPTLGAAIRLDDIELAYAFEHLDGGNVQRVGLTFRP
jgi:hypothetical protein